MSIWDFLFKSKLGPREMTVGEILGRKVVKQEIKDLVSEDDNKKAAEYNPVIGKLALCHLIAKLAEMDKEAPFKSEAQRRKFYAMAGRGEISKGEVHKWEEETPDKKLPERVHKKSAGIMGSLPWLTLAPGKALKTIGWGASILGPGIAAAKGKMPSQMASQPRMAAEVDRLIALTKVGLEFHSHMQASTDTAEPVVKKKSLSKSSGLISAVSPGAMARVTSALTKGPSSSTSNWLKRSTTGSSELSMGRGPQGKQMAGMSGEEQTMAAGRGSHIQRGV